MFDWVATRRKIYLARMKCQIFNIMKVKGAEAEKHNQKQWSRFQSLVYQQVMGEVLSSLWHAPYWGAQIKCADEIKRHIYPFILSLIADNQEWYITILILMLIGTNTSKLDYVGNAGSTGPETMHHLPCPKGSFAPT